MRGNLTRKYMDEEARMDLHSKSYVISLIETKSGDKEVVMVEIATIEDYKES